MKLHKLISRTVVATALLGATFGGVFSGTKVSANASNDEQLNHTISDRSDDYSSSGSNDSGTQADITSGLLTLNAVPNFNFGNNDSNDSGNNQDHRQLHLMNTDPTHSNTMGENTNDGNNDNLLSVTDYRKVHQNDRNGGWTVSAKMSGFQPIDDTTDSQYTSSDQSSKWMINLTENTPSSNYHANNYNRYDNSNHSDNSTNNTGPTISNNAKLPSDSNSTANFMYTNNNYTNGHGTTNVNYGSNDTSLTTPYNVQPGKYTATITWTLSSNPTSGSN